METCLKRVVLIGSKGVGKSLLTSRFVGEECTKDNDSVMKCEFYLKKFKNEEVQLGIFDPSHEDFEANKDNYIQNADAFIGVFDVTNYESFHEMKDYWKLIKEKRGNIPFVLVANKIELEDQRKVPREEARKAKKEMGVPLFDTSAEMKLNHGKVFNRILHLMKHSMENPTEVDESDEDSWCTIQ